MARDLRDAWGWIEKLIRRVERLESGANLENSSITEGRMRFIGGLLRIDSGGRLEIVGTLQIDGTTTVTGTFQVDGPWQLNGDGTITGAVTITGTVTMQGDMNLTGNITILPGGKIQVGDVVIDPTNGGSVTFPGGAVVRGQSGNGIEVTAGAYSAVVREGYARFGTSALNFEIDGFTGLSINGIQQEAGLGTPAGTVHVLSGGQLRQSNGF